MSSLPLRLSSLPPVGTRINIGINVVLDTETDFDFLYLSVKSSGGVEDFLLRSKSLDDTKTVQWDLWKGHECQWNLLLHYKV
ncbi:hypothetical protein BASA60_004541 [Batrachochytrium salamandrivorans]|nr:hypothetical protein BASA60_004541 [Batrachochytrium salamandrivorans]